MNQSDNGYTITPSHRPGYKCVLQWGTIERAASSNRVHLPMRVHEAVQATVKIDGQADHIVVRPAGDSYFDLPIRCMGKKVVWLHVGMVAESAAEPKQPKPAEDLHTKLDRVLELLTDKTATPINLPPVQEGQKLEISVVGEMSRTTIEEPKPMVLSALKADNEHLTQEIATYRKLNDELRAELKRRDEVDKNITWYWMSEGDNDLASITCQVIIKAEDLRQLLAVEASGAWNSLNDLCAKHDCLPGSNRLEWLDEKLHAVKLLQDRQEALHERIRELERKLTAAQQELTEAQTGKSASLKLASGFVYGTAGVILDLSQLLGAVNKVMPK